MDFAVFLHPKAAEALEKLEISIKERITENLKELRDRPEKVGKPLKYSDFWRLRIGDYRAICELPSNKWGGFCPPRLFCLANTVGHMQPSHRQFGLVHGSPRPSRDT